MTRQPKKLTWATRDREFFFEERPAIMGILNVTPDSFSDGGRFVNIEDAVAYGCRMAREGADIIDVGGESTRPGAAEVSPEEEIRRVVPVVRALCDRTDAVVSIDTRKAEVAARAVEAGAGIINDVSAMSHDPDMAAVAADHGAGVVLMHMRGSPETMQKDPRYTDVVADIGAYLSERVDFAVRAGVCRDAIAVDPGIGFGKTVDHNLALLSHLPQVGSCGRPVVVGLSRKSFLGTLLQREVCNRMAGSLGALVYCVLNGAHVMRVHDTRESFDAARIAALLRAAEETS